MLTQQLKSQILKRNELSLPLLCSYFPFSFCFSINLFLIEDTNKQASKKKKRGRKKEEDELREREGL